MSGFYKIKSDDGNVVVSDTDGNYTVWDEHAQERLREQSRNEGITVVVADDHDDPEYPLLLRAEPGFSEGMTAIADSIETLRLIYANVRDDRPRGADCPVCWGTGFFKGAGAPCKRGCKPPEKKRGLAQAWGPKSESEKPRLPDADPDTQAWFRPHSWPASSSPVRLVEVRPNAANIEDEVTKLRQSLLDHESPFALRWDRRDYEFTSDKDHIGRWVTTLVSRQPTQWSSYIWHFPDDLMLTDYSEPALSDMTVLFDLKEISHVPSWCHKGSIVEQPDPTAYYVIDDLKVRDPRDHRKTEVVYRIIDPSTGQPGANQQVIRLRHFLWRFSHAPHVRFNRPGFQQGGMVKSPGPSTPVAPLADYSLLDAWVVREAMRMWQEHHAQNSFIRRLILDGERYSTDAPIPIVLEGGKLREWKL